MTEVGDRVVFDGFGQPDPYSRLQPGTEGTVILIDDAGSVHVKWDDGGTLAMITQPIPWLSERGFRPDRFHTARSDGD